MALTEELKTLAYKIPNLLDRATRMDMLIVFSGASNMVQENQLITIVAKKLKVDLTDATALCKEYVSKLKKYDSELYKEFYG